LKGLKKQLSKESCFFIL